MSLKFTINLTCGGCLLWASATLGEPIDSHLKALITNNRQTQDLKLEQQSYRDRLQQSLQRQLQHHQLRQAKGFSLHGRAESASHLAGSSRQQLQQFRRSQEAQRLNFRIERRAWPNR